MTVPSKNQNQKPIYYGKIEPPVAQKETEVGLRDSDTTPELRRYSYVVTSIMNKMGYNTNKPQGLGDGKGRPIEAMLSS